MSAIALLFKSRKFTIALLSTASGVGLCVAGKLPVEHLAAFVGTLTLVLIHSIAKEDAATKSRAVMVIPKKDPPT